MIKGMNNMLADYGYNLVALPKAGIALLDLLFKRDGSLGRVGASAIKLFEMGAAEVPETSENVEVIDISDSIALMFDAKAGARMTSALAHLPKAVTMNANYALNTNEKILVNYQHIREDSVDLLALDNFLHLSRPKAEEFGTFKKKLYGSELYVISAVLKSNRFTVTIADEQAQQASVDVKVPSTVEIDTNISSNRAKKILLQYDGGTELIFAFKAQRIIFDHKRWWEFWEKGPDGFRIKDVIGETLKSHEKFPTFPLKPEREPIDLA